MVWKIEFENRAKKQLDRFNFVTRQRITKYLKRIEQEPLNHAEPLSDEFKGLYKFRVGDYRLIAQIKNEILTVTIVKIGHRRQIYNH